MENSTENQESNSAQDNASPIISDLESQIASLKNEAAKYRTARNDALKKAHAQAAVLKAHNIVHDFDAKALEALTIEDGKASGIYEYAPPATIRQDLPVPETKSGITRADIRNMSIDQINDNWAEISKVMANDGG